MSSDNRGPRTEDRGPTTDVRGRLFVAACAAMFVFGIVLAILGALFGLPAMRERLAVSLAQQGDIFLALFFGIFLSTIFVGPMIDSFGNKVVLTVSAALVTIANSIVAEVAAQLAKKGKSYPTFVSPNVPGIPRENNMQVFEAYEKVLKR